MNNVFPWLRLELGLPIANNEAMEDEMLEGYAKGTSVNEMRNSKFRAVCSEIIEVITRISSRSGLLGLRFRDSFIWAVILWQKAEKHLKPMELLMSSTALAITAPTTSLTS